eukprot:3375935-Rhodomonas_salina.6
MPTSDPAYEPTRKGIRYGAIRSTALSAYAMAMRCPVLTWRVVIAAYAMSGASGGVSAGQIPYAVRLRACYAMLGTDIPFGHSRLRACYAMSGTDMAHGATSSAYTLPQVRTLSLPVLRYALSGTDI